MQGGRYDGRPWPGYGAEMNVPPWEADDLVRAKIAEYVDEPAKDRGYDVLRTPDQYFEDHLKLADGSDPDEAEEELREVNLIPVSDDSDDDFERGDGDNEDEGVTPQVKRPSTVDNKAAWIEWAVSQGADREKAAAKTKAMLIADY